MWNDTLGQRLIIFYKVVSLKVPQHNEELTQVHKTYFDAVVCVYMCIYVRLIPHKETTWRPSVRVWCPSIWWCLYVSLHLWGMWLRYPQPSVYVSQSFALRKLWYLIQSLKLSLRTGLYSSMKPLSCIEVLASCNS